jgi:AcrR family transcriptional regulator
MPRTAVLNQEIIAAAALAVIDRDGLSALTMRSLGRELGVAAMSLYNHVADRAALESVVVSAVMSSIDTTPVAAEPMSEVKRLMAAMRDALNVHPEAIPLVLTRPTASETALAPIEALLAALSAGGFVGIALLRAYRTLFGFLIGFVQADLTGPVSSGQPATLSEVAAGVLSLPANRFPHLRACARDAATSNSDSEFQHGLNAVLLGLTTLDSATGKPSKGSLGD